MLHLIFQSPIDVAILQRLECNDNVVFLENAVFQLNKASVLNDELLFFLKKGISFAVLKEELETRGITIDELVFGIEELDYAGFVKLTENNKVIRTWN